jgi:hypothetical protein
MCQQLPACLSKGHWAFLHRSRRQLRALCPSQVIWACFSTICVTHTAATKTVDRESWIPCSVLATLDGIGTRSSSRNQSAAHWDLFMCLEEEAERCRETRCLSLGRSGDSTVMMRVSLLNVFVLVREQMSNSTLQTLADAKTSHVLGSIGFMSLSISWVPSRNL